MTTKDLLFELGCEELPPTTLTTLRDHLLSALCAGLEEASLSYTKTHGYATPRRLAIWVEGLQTAQADKLVEKRGPALAAAYDKEGKPSKAALGFARGCGADFNDLETLKTDKANGCLIKNWKKANRQKPLFQLLLKMPLLAYRSLNACAGVAPMTPSLGLFTPLSCY